MTSIRVFGASLAAACAVCIFVACSSSDDATKSSPTPDGGGTAPSADGSAPTADAAVSPWPVLVPLTGCAPWFMAPIQVGGQSFNVMVDTGSATLALADKSCTTCVDAGPTSFYADKGADTDDAGASRYGDGTITTGWSGEIYRDSMNIVGATSPTPVSFVAIEQQNDFFGAQGTTCLEALGDGIMGMGPAAGAATGTDGIFDRLVASGMPATMAIRQCLRNGQLWLGGFDPSAGSAAPQYVPLEPLDLGVLGWNVVVSNMHIGDKALGTAASYGESTVDSGAGAIVLPTDVYNALVSEVTSTDAYKNLFADNPFFDPGEGFGNCIIFTDAQAATLDTALPHMTINLGADGATTLDLPATSSYIIPITRQGQRLYCPGVVQSSNLAATGNNNAAILGYPVFRSQIVVFDVAQHRLGFMPAKPNAECQ